MHRRIFRRAPSVAVALAAALVAMLLTAVPANAATPTATFTKVSDWGTGWEGRFIITNGGSTPSTDGGSSSTCPPGRTSARSGTPR